MCNVFQMFSQVFLGFANFSWFPSSFLDCLQVFLFFFSKFPGFYQVLLKLNCGLSQVFPHYLLAEQKQEIHKSYDYLTANWPHRTKPSRPWRVPWFDFAEAVNKDLEGKSVEPSARSHGTITSLIVYQSCGGGQGMVFRASVLFTESCCGQSFNSFNIAIQKQLYVWNSVHGLQLSRCILELWRILKHKIWTQVQDSDFSWCMLEILAMRL